MGLLDNFDMEDPKNMGLLQFGLSMLQNSGPSSQPKNFGQIFGASANAGLQSIAASKQKKEADEFRKMQLDALKAQETQRLQTAESGRVKTDALARIAAAYQADPNYKPSMGDLIAIDPSAVIKGMMPGGAVDYGLEPKVGKNPSNGKMGYFVQDKRGGTRWLDAEPTDNLKLIPGTDYQAPQSFNPRSGVVSPAQGANLFQQPPSASMQPEQSTIDPTAPWSNLRSPKEVDEMKSRTYEQDNKRLDELRTRVGQGRSMMNDLERFGELNRKQATGGLADRFSAIPTFDSDKREMEAITARLAPNMRPAGSGTTSDRDLALFLQSLPSIDKTGDTNQNIRNQYASQLKEAEGAYAFQQKYLTEKGYLNGVDEAYKNSRRAGLDESKLTPEQRAYLQQQDPEAYANGVTRMNSGATPPKKSLTEMGYGNQQDAIKDARNTIMKNPSAKAEVIRRLEANGITNHGLK